MGWAMLREGDGIGQERFREKIVRDEEGFDRGVARVAKEELRRGDFWGRVRDEIWGN